MKVLGRSKSLSIDVGIISFGRLAAFGLSLIIPLVLTRVLSLEDYGIYKELSLLIVTLQPILLFGIPSSLRYFIPRSSVEEKRRYMTQALIFTVLVGFCLFIVFTLAGGLITEALFHRNLSEFMMVMGAHGFLLITAAYIGVVMIVNDDVNLASITAIVFSILDVVIMCGGVILFPSVMGLLLAILFATLIKFIIAVIYILRNFEPGISYISKSSIRKQLGFSAPLGLSDVVNILNINVDKFYIAFFFAQEAFGVYSIGALITPVILVVYRSVFDIVVPQFSKLYKQLRFSELIKLWHEGVRKLALLFYPAFIFLILFAYELITILFPEAYSGSVPVFTIYLFILPLTVTFFNGVLIAAGDTKFLLKATLIAFIINLILNYALIQWFMGMEIGLLGPPTATIIVNVILRALLLYRIKNIMKRPVSELYPWQLLGKLMGVCIISGFATLSIMLALFMEPLGGLLSLTGIFPDFSLFMGTLPDITVKIILVTLGFVCFFGIYYALGRKMDLIRDGDMDMIKRFLGFKN
jgi:O-antigen/teichoic acid export membrane protein